MCETFPPAAGWLSGAMLCYSPEEKLSVPVNYFYPAFRMMALSALRRQENGSLARAVRSSLAVSLRTGARGGCGHVLSPTATRFSGPSAKHMAEPP